MPAFLLSPMFLKAMAVVAVVLALAFAWHRMKEGYREEGREEVRAEVKAAQAAQEAAWAAQAAKTAQVTKERDNARRQAFKAAAERDQLAAEIANTRVPGGFVGSLRTSTDLANAAGAPGKPNDAPAPAAGAADSTLGLIAGWYSQVAEIHAECRDRVAQLVSYYNGLREVQQ